MDPTTHYSDTKLKNLLENLVFGLVSEKPNNPV